MYVDNRLVLRGLMSNESIQGSCDVAITKLRSDAFNRCIDEVHDYFNKKCLLELSQYFHAAIEKCDFFYDGTDIFTGFSLNIQMSESLKELNQFQLSILVHTVRKEICIILDSGVIRRLNDCGFTINRMDVEPMEDNQIQMRVLCILVRGILYNELNIIINKTLK